jgi:class 3 adenylate cyclase
VVRGRIRVQMDDGTAQEMGPEDIYDIPPGHDAWVVSDDDAEIFDWAGGMGTFAKPAIEASDRLLTTLLFTDIVGSTSIAERIGDTAWRSLLAGHNSVVRRELDRYRGREVATTGDGFLAMFDSAARAVRCAASICAAVQSLELTVRTAVHTGEVELVAGDVRGLAVHAAARIGQLAEPGEVMVSDTTVDLLQASGLRFEERGTHELKGLSGSRRVYRYVGEEPPPA